MENLNENIISFIISPPIEGWFFIFKIVLIVFSLLLLGLVIVLAIKSTWLKFLILQDIAEILTYRPYGVKKIVKAWNKVLGRLETALESEYKLAVIEADSMMDDILKRMGFPGETLGERLKNLTSATLPNIKEIEEAHRIRNNIVHDPDYKLSLDEAKRVLNIYEQAFRDLQAF